MAFTPLISDSWRMEYWSVAAVMFVSVVIFFSVMGWLYFIFCYVNQAHRGTGSGSVVHWHKCPGGVRVNGAAWRAAQSMAPRHPGIAPAGYSGCFFQRHRGSFLQSRANAAVHYCCLHVLRAFPVRALIVKKILLPVQVNYQRRGWRASGRSADTFFHRVPAPDIYSLTKNSGVNVQSMMAKHGCAIHARHKH